MKKYIALTLALVLLSLGSIIAVGRDINKDKDSVTYSEKVIWGDPTIAEGVVVKSASHYQNHLVWNTNHTIGGDTETEYKFHFTKHYSSSKPSLSGFILHTDIAYGFDIRKPASEQFGIARVYKEFYDSLDYDEKGSKIIKLADYYDYYPISVNVNLPTLFLNATVDSFSENRNVISTARDQNDKKVYDDICNFFKIPVLDSEYVEISVSKYHGNNVGFGHGYSDKATDVYSMYTSSTYTDKACYIYVNNRTDIGNIMDFSNIPGGYGIYALPYEGAKLKSDELAMVYKLDEETLVSYITVSADNSKLLLTVSEDGASYFEVVDIATMKQLQKFKISDGSHRIVYPNDRFTVYEFDDHIAVIEEKDGSYELVFAADKFSDENADEEYFYFRTGAALDFDGEKLIVVDNILTDQTWYDKCGFYVAVYTKDGLQYFGEYESSLDANLLSSGNYGFNCRPLTSFEVKLNK